MSENVEVPQTASAQPANYEMKIANYRAYRLVRFALGFVEVLLGLRFVFKLFGANPLNIFAEVLYGLSWVLVLPFSGLFRGNAVPGAVTVSIFEPSTVVAMIVYALIAWGVGKWILIFKGKPSSRD